MATKDLSGTKVGRLTLLSRAGVVVSARGSRSYRYNCKCDCGTGLVVRSANLSSGNTKSCGCLHKESTSLARTTHGASHTPEHNTWDSMHRRCYDPSNASYQRYGGRGIKVCKRWHKFENFLADMGERPEGKSLDRYPDNDGNYEPGNCRWATSTEQSWNKRGVVLYSYDGVTMPSGHWAKKLGVPSRTLFRKLRADASYLSQLHQNQG